MAHIQQLIQNNSQHDPNTAALSPPKPTPLGPPPMVLQNPLPHQGMVETKPLAPQAPITTVAAQPAEASVHHLMRLSSEVNL